MIQIRNKKSKITIAFLSLVVLFSLVSGFLWFDNKGSVIPTQAAESGKTKISASGQGTLIIKTNPATITTTAYIDGTGIPIINGTSSNLTLDEGIHYILFDPNDTSGYTVPEPDLNFFNDDSGNLDPSPIDPVNKQGRRVYITADETTILTLPFYKESFLKQLGRTTAETLLFTPSATKTINGLGLLRGVAEISADGVHWQKSIAEVLYIGSMPQPFIEKYPSTGSKYLAAGSAVEYYIDFQVLDTPSLQYNATITDTITTSDDTKVTVLDASIDYSQFPVSNGGCNGITLPAGSTTVWSPASKTVVYNIKNATRACKFRVKLKLGTDKDISTTLTISDLVEISAEGATANDKYDSSVIPLFTQENVGGDIYARGNNPNSGGLLDLGPLGGGLYVLGANGNVSAVSEKNWVMEGYKIRAKSMTDFNPDDCVAGTTCKTMLDNVKKLKNNPTKTIGSGVSNFNFDSSIPEGEVWVKSMPLGSTCTLYIDSVVNIPVQNKGTLLVENCDVEINQNIIKSSGSILGIIVHNGNVIIGKDVTEVDALFYIYSDQGLAGNKGSFITETRSPDYDDQLVVKGLVISSGYSSGIERKDAFILKRNWIGDIYSSTYDPNSNAEPAELFQYDGMVIINPPPGFGGESIKL